MGISNVYGRSLIASNVGNSNDHGYVWNPNYQGEMINYIEDTNLQHTHNYDHKHNITADGGTEARPDNYTIRVWKRTA